MNPDHSENVKAVTPKHYVFPVAVRDAAGETIDYRDPFLTLPEAITSGWSRGRCALRKQQRLPPGGPCAVRLGRDHEEYIRTPRACTRRVISFATSLRKSRRKGRPVLRGVQCGRAAVSRVALADPSARARGPGAAHSRSGNPPHQARLGSDEAARALGGRLEAELRPARRRGKET